MPGIFITNLPINLQMDVAESWFRRDPGQLK